VDSNAIEAEEVGSPYFFSILKSIFSIVTLWISIACVASGIRYPRAVKFLSCHIFVLHDGSSLI
jgi:hypothetical protein